MTNNFKNIALGSLITIMSITTTVHAEQDCTFSPENIKQSIEVKKIVTFVRDMAKKEDLSKTIRNLRGLEKAIPFTECTIIGETKACDVLKKDAIAITSNNIDMSVKLIWDNPSEPETVKLKVATNSTICTYNILKNKKIVPSDVTCKITEPCSNKGGWFNW